MARRTFRYDPRVDKMVEITDAPVESASASVLGDFAPFVSPVDGTVISGRAQYRAYMAERGLVPYEEAKTQKAEGDRYENKRAEQRVREQMWENVDRLVRTGRGPNQ